MHLGPEKGEAFEGSRKRYIERAEEQVSDLLANKPRTGQNWSKWLQRFGILVTAYGGLSSASALASPSPEQQELYDRFLAAYKRVLHQKRGTAGSASREAMMDLGDAASNWGRSMGFSDSVNNSIQCGLYFEGTVHP